eukprot:FR736281.1.p2 GENE.FR736281.1~~FR736281.1.p2  ORF type:complete len:174 (+),score=40.99 FR736281.1:473-994(+)
MGTVRYTTSKEGLVSTQLESTREWALNISSCLGDQALYQKKKKKKKAAAVSDSQGSLWTLAVTQKMVKRRLLDKGCTSAERHAHKGALKKNFSRMVKQAKARSVQQTPSKGDGGSEGKVKSTPKDHRDHVDDPKSLPPICRRLGTPTRKKRMGLIVKLNQTENLACQNTPTHL